jgi:hypothetical protein
MNFDNLLKAKFWYTKEKRRLQSGEEIELKQLSNIFIIENTSIKILPMQQ